MKQQFESDNSVSHNRLLRLAAVTTSAGILAVGLSSRNHEKTTDDEPSDSTTVEKLCTEVLVNGNEVKNPEDVISVGLEGMYGEVPSNTYSASETPAASLGLIYEGQQYKVCDNATRVDGEFVDHEISVAPTKD